MRWKPPRGRLSPADQRRRINAGHAFAASLCPTPEIAAAYKEKFVREIAPKAHRVRRPVDGKPAVPLERHVLADVLHALRNDPRIAYVWRQSSGTFMDGDRYIQAGPKGMPDVIGFLRGGRALFIEVKRPGGKPDPHQQAKLDHFKRMGAVSGCATSVDEALALLPC